MDDDTTNGSHDPEPEPTPDPDPELRVVRRPRSTRRSGSRRSGAIVGPHEESDRSDAETDRSEVAAGVDDPETAAPEAETDHELASKSEDVPPDEKTAPEAETDHELASESEDVPPDEKTAPEDEEDSPETAEPDPADARASVMPPADQPDDVDPVSPAAPESARSKLAMVGVALVVLGLLTWIAFFREEEVAAPPPTTTPSTTTTTDVQAGWPAQTTQVATAKAGLPEVTVLAAPPPEWESETQMLRWEAPALPASQAMMEPRPALPRPGYDIEGRYATDTGWTFANPTSFGQPLTFVVTEARGDWLKVLLPVRPNHTEAYVSRDQVDLSQHDYRIELRLSEHRLSAFQGSELIADTPVVTGKDATRTPTGRFFITDKVEQSNPEGFYGPFVLALNGYSEQLDIFDDGVPVIAIHGTNRPDLLGTSASNGCVRIPNEVITQLHDQLPLGTPVEVYA